LRPPGTVRLARARFVEVFRRPGLDRPRGAAGQGFMSTQRRESRRHRTGCTQQGSSGLSIAGPSARCACAIPSGETAPTNFSSWFATNSLHSGYRIVQQHPLIHSVCQELRLSSPPTADFGAVSRRPACHDSFPAHLPPPAVRARLLPA
jgi:hypothetical protein